MVDVGRDNRPTSSNFTAHKLGGDFLWNAGAEGLAGMLIICQALLPSFLQFHVFANRDVFHLRCNNAFAGVMHLGNVLTFKRPQWFALIHETKRIKLWVFHATAGIFRGVIWQG